MPLTRTSISVGEVIHLEVYAVPVRHRTEFRRRARKPIARAREITRAGGGNGPHFYRLEPRRVVGGVPGLEKLLKVRPSEDLWVEITFYPNSRRRQAIIKSIRSDVELEASLESLESLVSKRSGAWAIANAVLQPI